MRIDYACFVSYAHGDHALMKQFKLELVEALHSYLEPHLDVENELFVDTEQLAGGDDIERNVALALWHSVCMLPIYTPRYELHKFTRREFAAMEAFERLRAQWVRLPSRLIIPVIMMRHPQGLPRQVTERGFYLDFSGYTLATPSLKSNPEFLPQIQRLVERIALQYHLLRTVNVPDSFDEKLIALPEVIPPWREGPDLHQ